VPEQPRQGYAVYREGETFRARGQVDQTEIGSSGRAWQTIQLAIDSLGDTGGEVALQSGRFPLTQPVRLRDNVWLHGSGRGTSLLVSGGEENVGLLCEGLEGAVVSDLALRPAEGGTALAGLVLDDCGDCRVRDVLCKRFAGYGVWVRNNSFLCEIRSCSLAGNAKANLYLSDLANAGRGGDYVPNLVANCTTYGGGTGIECHKTIVLNVIGCQVHQPGGFGYHCRDSSNSVLISGCRSFQVEKDAVRVESSHEINISSNVFCWHRGNGIVLKDVSWGAVNGNEVIDSGVRARDGSPMVGILLRSGVQGVQVVGNTVFNWGDQCPMQVGIREDDTCRSNLIAMNSINYCVQADIIAEGADSVVNGNVARREEAYQHMGRLPFPDFNRQRISRFIGE